jgi:hypothetical protein
MRFLAVFTAGLVWAGAVSGQVTSIEMDGNLGVTHETGCIPVARIAPEYSPADLMAGARECVGKGKFELAMRMQVIALMRGAYDTVRVTDKTAHQAVQALMLQMHSAMDERERQEMARVFVPFQDRQSSLFRELCKSAAGMAPPDYYPSYMIQHGMDAVTGRTDAPLKEDFDPQHEWDEVVYGYVNCPG